MVAALYGGMAALQLAGGYFAAQNIRATAALNKDINEMNAQFAELDAYDTNIAGENESVRYQSVIDKTLGEQQLAMTASGVDVNYGSAASVQKETKFIGELNKMEIEKRAQEKALGYTRQARDLRLQGSLDSADAKTRAGQAIFQGVMGAAQTGLSGYQRSR